MDNLDQMAERLEDLVPRLMKVLSLPQEIDPLSDLTPAQLRFVRALQNRARGLSEIALELGMSLSAATQLVQRLEEAGLVERNQDPDDRRVRRVRLSVQGLAKLEARRCLRLKTARKLLASMPLAERNLALASLERLATGSGAA